MLKILHRFRKWVLCKVIDILVLNSNGSYVSFTNFRREKIPLDIKTFTFTGTYEQSCKKTKYYKIVDKIKRIDVFKSHLGNNEEDKHTIVHKKNTVVKQDDLIGISTIMANNVLFVTGFLRIAVLEETENSLILCMSTCIENVVNGYYRFVLNYDEKNQKILLKYSKVQHFTTIPLRFLVTTLNYQSYINNSKTSVMNTFNYLFQEEIFIIDDVYLSYE